MKYFAMIDGARRGPFELAELADAGVRPDTYVWCKTMDDWQQARDVADICRHFRQRLAGIPASASVPSAEAAGNAQEKTVSESEQNLEGIPVRFRSMVEKSGIEPGTPLPDMTDCSSEPKSHLVLAVLVAFLCFPLTGLVAVYYSVMTRRLWNESEKRGEDADACRDMAHDYSRQTKMWIGITFFLGLIFYAFIVRFFM